MAITQEVLVELRPFIRQEVERAERERREGQNAWKRAVKALEERLRQFDYVEAQDYFSADGRPLHYEDKHICEWQIRNAFSALLRCVYQANGTARIPAEKEGEMVKFMGSVLTLMEQLQKGA